MFFDAPISPPLIIRPSTMQTVQNTTTETTAVEFTIPANTFTDKYFCEMIISRHISNTTGAAANLTTALWLNGSSINNNTVSIANSTNNRINIFWLGFSRGTGFLYHPNITTTLANQKAPLSATTGQSSNSATLTISSSNTLSVKITLATASTNFYFEPYTATLRIYNQ